MPGSVLVLASPPLPAAERTTSAAAVEAATGAFRPCSMDPGKAMEDTAGAPAASQAATVNGGRRPMNAFLLFCKRHRGIVKEKYPTLENRNITKILGDWWQSLGEEDKASFQELAIEFLRALSARFQRRRPRKCRGRGVIPGGT